MGLCISEPKERPAVQQRAVLQHSSKHWGQPHASHALLVCSAALGSLWSQATQLPSLSCWLKKCVFADFLQRRAVSSQDVLLSALVAPVRAANFADFKKEKKPTLSKSRRCLLFRRREVAWEAVAEGSLSRAVGSGTVIVWEAQG